MKKEQWHKRLKSLGFQIAAFYLIAGLLILSLFSVVVYFVVSDIFVKESIAKTEMAIEKTAADIGADIHLARLVSCNCTLVRQGEGVALVVRRPSFVWR